MARFDPQLQPQDDSNFLAAPKSVDVGSPNKGFGVLFGGLAETLDAGVKGIDEGNVNRIKKEVYDIVDGVNDQHGVNAAIDMQNSKVIPPLVPNDDEGNPMPAAISGNGRRQMAGLQQAFEEGKMTDLQYYTRLTAQVKSLRQRYPGYRDKIDQIVRGVVGTDPANATRRELLSTWEEAQKKRAESANSFQKFKDTYAEFLPANHESMTEAEVRKYVYDVQQQDHALKSEKQKIELAASRGNLTEKEAEQAATVQAQLVVNRLLDTSLDKLGYNKIQQMISDITKRGTPPTDEERRHLELAFNQLEHHLGQNLHRELTTVVKGKDGKAVSLNSFMSPEKFEQIKKQAMAPVTMMKQALISGDFGIIPSLARDIKFQKDQDYATLVKKYPVMRGIEIFQQTLGPEGMKIWLGQGQNASDLEGMIRNFTIGGVFGANKDVNTLATDIATTPGVNRSEKDTATAVKTLVDSTSHLVSDPKYSVQSRAAAAKSIFGKGSELVFEKFRGLNVDKKDSRMRLYGSYVNPQTTKSMVEIRDKDPNGREIWENYKKFALTGFQQLFKEDSDSLYAGDPQGNFTVVWDENKKGFMIQNTERGEGMLRRGSGIWGSPSDQGASVYGDAPAAIERFNRALDGIKPILEADGIDPKQAVQEFIDTKAMNQTKPGIWQMMKDAIGNMLSPDGKPKNDGSSVLPTPKPAPKPGKTSKLDSIQLAMYDEKEIAALPVKRFEPTDYDEDFDVSDVATLTSGGTHYGLLEVIKDAESNGNYNIMWGNKEYPLTEMSIGEVMELQRRLVKNGAPSVAAGAYQVISSTLKMIVQKLGLDLDTPFNEKTQDLIAMALLKGKGYDAWRKGEITDQKFLYGVSKEWAGIPNPITGKSYYAGDGLNASTVKLDRVIASLTKVRKAEERQEAKLSLE